jgi:sortase A
MVSNLNQTVAINNYNNEISSMTSNDLQKAEESAKEFNEDLYESNSFSASLTEETISTINFIENDILAYIIIPKINIELPIYEGANEQTLSLGIGHLSNTSLPVGGNNTHCVLVGHTGLSSAVMFDDIDKLEISDKFYIKVLDKTLEYEVTKVDIVLPDETENLVIQENSDLVTLVTCTPKYVNTHRLLVTGKRVEEENMEQNNVENYENKEQEIKIEEQIHKSYKYIFFILGDVVIIFMLIFLLGKSINL